MGRVTDLKMTRRFVVGNVDAIRNVQSLALAGLPPVRRRISARAAYAAGAVLEGIWTVLGRTDEPRMTRFLAAQLATSHYFNLARARQDFAYRPAISTAEGMRRMAAAGFASSAHATER